jgi:tRNA-Thr(GGU) m(6)t(6)A37 methyltransferase TsaA
MKIEVKPIGVIHTPFTRLEGMPIQPSAAEGTTGTVEVFEEFLPGLKDLDGFSHLILLYFFHKSVGYKLQVVPYLDSKPHGLFATRAPKRPNQIGLSIVKLGKIEGGIIHVSNVDMLDGTPLLDIKPYVPSFDASTDIRIGWLEDASTRASRCKSDDRFT